MTPTETDAARRDRIAAERSALAQECAELHSALRWLLGSDTPEAREHAAALLARVPK